MHQFDDVSGLDVQHSRRVRWCRLPREYEFGTPLFGASPGRFSRIRNEKIVDYVERFLNSPPTHWQTAPLPELPMEEPALEEMPSKVQGIIAEVQDLAPLLWDRQAFGDHPTEDELVAHFVVPFLRALEWPLERIAVKWRHIDVADFRALPRTAENCHFVIEAKRLGAGVEGALEQAIGYVEALGTCCDIVVTDGVRYRMYACQRDLPMSAGQARFVPVAYANLVRLKKSATALFSRLRRP